MKEYVSAPLPFVGQKRMFIGEYKKVLKTISGASVFVDLFGGSGLLSHITKRERPDVVVIYNDFDGYRKRLEHIKETNQILHELRSITDPLPRHKLIPHPEREAILSLLEQKEREYGYLDCITLSSSLLFSSKYATSLKDLKKHSLYNNVRKQDYSADGYLDGLEITSCDYKVLFEKYKDRDDVVFLVDPPYLSTDVGAYVMGYWRLSDYLDVLKVLSGQRYVYFTSDKSSIVELCEWIGDNIAIGNPFAMAKNKEINAHLNYNAKYTDIMLYKVS